MLERNQLRISNFVEADVRIDFEEFTWMARRNCRVFWVGAIKRRVCVCRFPLRATNRKSAVKSHQGTLFSYGTYLFLSSFPHPSDAIHPSFSYTSVRRINVFTLLCLSSYFNFEKYHIGLIFFSQKGISFYIFQIL